MALNFTTTSQAAHQHGVKVLVYGRAGAGKTALCATAPAPIIISAESGLLSLSKQNLEKVYGANNPHVTYDIPVIQVQNVQELTAAFDWLQRAPEAAQFQTVCLDSLTEIAEQVLSNAKMQVKDPRQAYGELLEKMHTTVKAFRDLPGKHVYMSAKEERTKDDATGIVLAGPAMPGAKLGHQLPYLFDEVFNLNIGKNAGDGTAYRYLRTQPDYQYDAKDRSGALAEIEHPDLTSIFAKITGVV